MICRLLQWILLLTKQTVSRFQYYVPNCQAILVFGNLWIVQPDLYYPIKRSLLVQLFQPEEMGGCFSSSSQSNCSSTSNGEIISPSCLPLRLLSSNRNRKTYSDHVTTLQHFSSIPNRRFTNGKSRTCCMFTQQGRKGINQDAMIVWEVSSSILLFCCCYLGSAFLLVFEIFFRISCQKM